MYESPLRYPGGKGRLTQFIIDLIEMNGMSGGHYVEPYAGGAAIGIALLYLEYVDYIHLNDLNKQVFSFWQSVVKHPEALCRLIRDTPLTMDEWRRQRSIHRTSSDTLDLGFSTFFLNRTNRSGILHGGVIGGNAQTGTWKMDARYNRVDLARRVERLASYAPRIKLYNIDAADFLRYELPSLGRKVLVYLDPPYYGKKYRLYENSYRPEDHTRIATIVAKMKQNWIVSYDNALPIRELYGKFRQQVFSLRYTAWSQHDGTEVMIFGDTVKSPGMIEPWRGIAA
jgi:DNA adenine methylase